MENPIKIDDLGGKPPIFGTFWCFFDPLRAVHLCDKIVEVQKESTWALASWQPRRWLARQGRFWFVIEVCFFLADWVEWLKNLSVKGAKLQRKNRSSHRQTSGRKGEGRQGIPVKWPCFRQGTNPPTHQRYHGQSKSDGPSWKGFVGVTLALASGLVYLSLHFDTVLIRVS